MVVAKSGEIFTKGAGFIVPPPYVSMKLSIKYDPAESRL